MALFQYKALSGAGKIVEGKIDASDKEEAVRRLQSDSKSILELTEHTSLSLPRISSWKQRTNDASVAAMTRQLATMVNAGMPLERALKLLHNLSSAPGLKTSIERIRSDVRDGSTLSAAFESQERLVPKLYISMLRAGETGGNLGPTLLHLADYLERSRGLKQTVVSALIYPALLLLMSLASIFALLTFVVPRFAPMFEELGGQLPLLTKIVLGAGSLLQNYWWLITVAAIAALILVRQQLMYSEKRLQLDRFLLRQPVLGSLIQKTEVARFARTLAALLANGVPILKGLALASEVVTNSAFKKGVRGSISEVKAGKSLASAMENETHFPDLALQMLAVGEETGRLSDILQKIAETYDQEVKVTIDRFMSILVPVLILILSAFIAIIVISILLAIMSMNDLFG